MRSWIERQSLFFTGTAPLDGDGHVNVSPKGPIGTLQRPRPDHARLPRRHRLRRRDDRPHARERPDRDHALRLRGPAANRPHPRPRRGRPRHRPRFDELLERGGFEQPAAPEARRAIVVVEATRIADSCGYGVPLMTYEGQRDHADLWAAKRLRTKGPDALVRIPAREERSKPRRPTRSRARRTGGAGPVTGTNPNRPPSADGRGPFPCHPPEEALRLSLELELVLEESLRLTADAVVDLVSPFVVGHREPGDHRRAVAAGDVGDGLDQRIGMAATARALRRRRGRP